MKYILLIEVMLFFKMCPYFKKFLSLLCAYLCNCILLLFKRLKISSLWRSKFVVCCFYQLSFIVAFLLVCLVIFDVSSWLEGILQSSCSPSLGKHFSRESLALPN